jgi:hypothetical protein
MHPESALSSFIGGNIPTRDFRWVSQVLLTFFNIKCWSSWKTWSMYKLDNLLCISKSSLDDHLKKPKEVLRRLCDMGLKVNSEKSTSCTLEIEYLGYILTRDGINPQSNKVQAILAIQPPTNVKELRHFLGMVQYYHDLCKRQSKMIVKFKSLCLLVSVSRLHQCFETVIQPCL